MRFGRLVLVLSLAASACTKNTDPNSAAYWVERADKKADRAEALKNLGRIGDKSVVATVLKYFKEDGAWQADAAYTLGQLGDAAVIPELVAALDSRVGAGKDTTTRNKNRLNINVVRALAMLRAKDMAEKIQPFVGAADPRVREAAIESLGVLGNPETTDAIVEVALNEKEPFLRSMAIRALGTSGDAKAVPALIQTLFAEAPGVSFYNDARFSLIELGAAAVPELVKTLKHENKTVEALRPGGAALPEGAIEAKAASPLGTLRAREAAEPIAAALTRLYERTKKLPPASPVRAAVVELAYALGNIGGDKTAAALLPIAKDKDASLRLAACEALITVGDASIVPALVEAAKTGDRAARRAALVAVSRLGTGNDLAAFDALAKVGDVATPAAAMAEMVKAERSRLLAAKECNKDPGCWTKKLADKDTKVRERATYELGWLGRKEALSDLMRVAEDADPEVRMAAVLTLGRLGGADPDKLQAIYDQWQTKLEYAGVNDELLRLIARAKSAKKK